MSTLNFDALVRDLAAKNSGRSSSGSCEDADESSALGWIEECLQQARLPPIVEAWRSSLPWLLQRSVVRRVLSPALLSVLHQACCHSSPVVRRLGICTIIEAERNMSSVSSCFAAFLAASAVSSLSVECVVTEVNIVKRSNGLALDDEPAVLSALSKRLGNIDEDSPFDTLRGLIIAALNGGNLLLTLSTFASVHQPGEVVEAAASARAANSGLKPVPRLVSRLIQACVGGMQRASSETFEVESALALLADVRSLCGRIPPEAMCAQTGTHLRYSVARSISLHVLEACLSNLANSARTEHAPPASVVAACISLPLWPHTALIRSLCSAPMAFTDCESRRTTENRSWLQDARSVIAASGQAKPLLQALYRSLAAPFTGLGPSIAILASIFNQQELPQDFSIPLHSITVVTEAMVTALQMRETGAAHLAPLIGNDSNATSIVCQMAVERSLGKVVRGMCDSVRFMLFTGDSGRSRLTRLDDPDFISLSPGGSEAFCLQLASFLYGLDARNGSGDVDRVSGGSCRLADVLLSHCGRQLWESPLRSSAVLLRAALASCKTADRAVWFESVRVELEERAACGDRWADTLAILSVRLLDDISESTAAVSRALLALPAMAASDITIVSADAALALSEAAGDSAGCFTGALCDPLPQMCEALAAASMGLWWGSLPPGLSEIDALHSLQLACAAITQIALALPSGAPRLHGVRLLATALFNERLWNNHEHLNADLPFLRDVQAALVDAAISLLEALAPSGGLETPGCDAYIIALARPALDAWRFRNATRKDTTNYDHLPPAATSLLCALAVAGEAGPVHPATLVGNWTAADVRAAASTLLSSAGSGAMPALQDALARAVAGPSALRAAKPGSPLLARQMRAWQMVATLALRECANTRHVSGTDSSWEISAASFARAAVAPLTTTVRQYVELAFGAFLASEAVQIGREGSSSLQCLMRDVRAAVASGSIPPTAESTAVDTEEGLQSGPPVPPQALRGVRVGWSNMVLLCTSACVAVELLYARSGAEELANGAAHELVDVLLVICATTQRRGVREALQCLLLRLAPRWHSAPLSGEPGLQAAALTALQHDPEVARTAANQPTLLQGAVGGLLSRAEPSSLAALVYCVLPVDDHIPPSERADLHVALEWGSPSHVTQLSNVQRARIACLLASVHARRSTAANEQDSSAVATDADEEEDAAGTGQGASALRKAQATLQHVCRALASAKAGAALAPPPPLPQFHRKARSAAARGDSDATAARLPRPAGHLTVIASLVSKPGNIGSIFRAVEALGHPGTVVVVGAPPASLTSHPDAVRMAAGAGERLARAGALKLVDARSLPSFLRAAAREPATRVIALELSARSGPLPQYQFFPPHAEGAADGDNLSPLGVRNHVLVLGHEVNGVPSALLAAASACVAVPQFGDTASLNVASAAAVALYEYGAQAARAAPPPARAGAGLG